MGKEQKGSPGSAIIGVREVRKSLPPLRLPVPSELPGKLFRNPRCKRVRDHVHVMLHGAPCLGFRRKVAAGNLTGIAASLWSIWAGSLPKRRVRFVSIHAPAGGRLRCGWQPARSSRCFNPRPRGGGDAHGDGGNHSGHQFQSTPPRGGDEVLAPGRQRPEVSIHAPAGGRPRDTA